MDWTARIERFERRPRTCVATSGIWGLAAVEASIDPAARLAAQTKRRHLAEGAVK